MNDAGKISVPIIQSVCNINRNISLKVKIGR